MSVDERSAERQENPQHGCDREEAFHSENSDDPLPKNAYFMFRRSFPAILKIGGEFVSG